MTFSQDAVDYTIQFTYKSLPKIYGEPTYQNIKDMKDKLCANAAKITRELGGSAHGHLWLVLHAPEYATVSAVPYVKPGHPGLLVIPPGTTIHISNILGDTHEKAIALFHEVIGLENALKKLIQDALDPEYLEELIDTDTRLILDDIPTILDHLFATYGYIDSNTVSDEVDKIKNMTFNVTDPLKRLYKAIENLDQLAHAAQKPKTEKQRLAIGLKVLKITNDYQKCIDEWYALPEVQQTWL